MTELELQQYFLHEYPQEKTCCEWNVLVNREEKLNLFRFS